MQKLQDKTEEETWKNEDIFKNKIKEMEIKQMSLQSDLDELQDFKKDKIRIE